MDLLAVGLITDHFGPLVAKVCDCLLRHGALPLVDIIGRVELSPGQVKNSLLIRSSSSTTASRPSRPPEGLAMLQPFLIQKDFLRSHTSWKVHQMQMIVLIVLVLVLSGSTEPLRRIKSSIQQLQRMKYFGGQILRNSYSV